MALDVPMHRLVEELGHDGSKIVFPELGDPERRRAFHVQEFILPCFSRGFALVSVEACPVLGASGGNFFPIPLGEQRLVQFLYNYNGVVIGEIRGQMHACAWDRDKCLDPAGYCHGLEELVIREFLALLPLKIQS
jgi:hypothetical protein